MILPGTLHLRRLKCTCDTTHVYLLCVWTAPVNNRYRCDITRYTAPETSQVIPVITRDARDCQKSGKRQEIITRRLGHCYCSFPSATATLSLPPPLLVRCCVRFCSTAATLLLMVMLHCCFYWLVYMSAHSINMNGLVRPHKNEQCS